MGKLADCINLYADDVEHVGNTIAAKKKKKMGDIKAIEAVLKELRADRDGVMAQVREKLPKDTTKPVEVKAETGQEVTTSEQVAAKEKYETKKDPLLEKKAEKKESGASPRMHEITKDNGIIEDFGEKIGGARKDTQPLSTKDYTDTEISSLPLSKLWPKEEIDKTEEHFIAAFSTAARAEIPTKPHKGYKLARWVEAVKLFRKVNGLLLNRAAAGEDVKEFIAKLIKEEFPSLKKLLNKVYLLEGLPRTHWSRIGAVDVHSDAYRFEDGKEVLHPYAFAYIDGRYQQFDGAKTIAEAIQSISQFLAGKDAPVVEKGAGIRFEVRGAKGSYFINKKGDPEMRKLKTFDTAEAAVAYRKNNLVDLIAEREATKERDNVKKTDVRRVENRQRVGTDRRNGKEVTPEMFQETFGFRGVEFDNWVSQGKNSKDRQGMLNQAFDALGDLADILGIPTKAISLNGSLGLGLGSRGHGWASAHYEADRVVINLTKTRGAGALAHEWFHALDNYFSNQRGGPVAFTGDQDKYREDNYITYKPEPMMVNRKYSGSGYTKARLAELRAAHPTSSYLNNDDWIVDPKHREGVRLEVETVFADLVEALNASPMAKRARKIDKTSNGYWSRVIERAARSFENYVIEKMTKDGYHNDYLANVISSEEFVRDKGRYPYLLPEEIKPVEEAFDNLFGTINTRETDKGVILYSRRNKSEWPADFPNAVTHTTLRKLREHPEYKAAKAGDIEAAARLAGDLVKPMHIKELFSRHPSAVVIAPHAIEASGENAIPQALAESFGAAGFEVDQSIVQTNKPQRTKKDSPLRLALRPEFSGEIEAGRDYILLDDAIGQGGTIAELRYFVESNGGRVVAVSALTSGIFSNKLSIRSETVAKLEEKYGREKLERFLDEFNTAGRIEALTEKEGRFILGQLSLDALRNRILADAQEANINATAWQVRSPLSEIVKRSTSLSTTPADVRAELAAHLSPEGVDDLLAAGTVRLLGSQQQAQRIIDRLKKRSVKPSIRYSKDGDIQGFTTSGKVYLVQDGISKGNSFAVLKHELGVHLRQATLNDATFQALVGSLEERQDEDSATGAAIRAAMQRVPEDTAQENYWEETLAYMVEDHPNNSLVKKFWRLIKQILRKIGVDIKSLTVDDMNDLALAAVRREAGGYIDETVKQENFNNWFGASRVVDGNGEPLVVYHGSRSFGDPDDQSSFTFKDSDVSASNTKSPGAGLGHFFAENRGDSVPFAGLSGGIFPVHLRIENPFETNSFDLPAFLTRTDAKKYRAKLSRMGYDGIYLADEAHWISFTPNQAKSADQNNGEFSRENDDVRFSKKKPSPLTASFVKGTPHTGLYKNTQAMAQLSPGAILTLTREADNVHDKNAVKIMLGTQAVGYVDKKINTKIAARMDAGERLQSRISKISGRPDAPRFTVLIGSSDAMAASPPAGSKDQSRPQPAAARRPSPRRHGQAAIDTLLLNVLGADKMAIMQDIRKNGLTAANEQELLTAEVAPEAPDDAGKTRELWKAQLFAAPKAIARKSLSLLTLRQLREIYRDVKPVENFYQATRETAADTTKLMGEADKVYEKWSKLDTKNADAMSMLMSEATVASVSPDVPFESRLDIDEAREKMEESADALVTLRNSTENVDAKVKWHEDRIRRLAGEIKDEQKRFSEHKRLSAKYEGLSKEAKAVYQEVRKMYDANLGRVRDGLLDRLNRSPMSETSKKMAMDSIRLKFETYLRNGPYFPLSRFGEYIVQITDADGNYERHEFDFIGQRDRAVARWSAEKDATGEPRWTIRQKTSKEYSPEADGASSQFVTDFAKIIDSSTLKAGEKSVLIDELNQLFIKSMPDMSHRKHFAHRKKVEGYSRDQIRAFASHMQHAAHHIARIRHADKMTQALSDLNEIVQTSDGNADLTHITDLFNELNKRHQILLNPKISPIAQALTSFGFIWNIGPSIASALVNMSQTPLVAFPMLGTRFNDGRGAFMELRQASAQYFGSPFVGSKGFDMSQNKKLSENARAMLATLEDDGTIDTSMALSLAQATSADLLNLAQTKNGGQMLKVMRVVSYPFHVTEVANRQITAVAAYELAIKHGKTHEEAISEAREVVLDSHFDYSQANRARFMEGNVQRVLFLFKQYSQQMSFLLGRSFHQAVKGESQAVKVQARKQLLGIVGGHFLVSGAFGMPVVGGIAEVLEFFVNALGDDDEPWDWESALRNMLADTVGKDAGEAIAHGPWRALPGLGELDIASRVSLGDLWFRTPEREMEGKDAWNQYINMALGPLASNGASMAQGLSAMSEGEVARGVEMMLPKAIKDAMKTIRYAREGVTSWNDATLIDELNTVEMFGQMLGFSPARINEMYEGKNAIKNLETKLDNRKQHLVNGWVEATRAGDVETANRIMKDMVQFTKKNPAFAITRQGLRQSMRMREKVQAQTKNGVYMPAKRAELLEEGRFSNI